jgi:transcriptional regulator with XRE-family HTH domain
VPRSRGPDPNALIFGKKLHALRTLRCWSLGDLGKLADMHPDYLGLVERGLNIPSLNTILRLAEVFDVPVAKLLDEVEAQSKARRDLLRRNGK